MTPDPTQANGKAFQSAPSGRRPASTGDKSMSVLGKRISRLEGPTGPYMPPIAVVSAPIPAIVTTAWAAALLATYGWSGQNLAVTVQEGEPMLLLKPTPFAWVKVDAETIWLGAAEQFPNATILSSPEGLLVNRFDNEGELRRWMIDTERELAA